MPRVRDLGVGFVASGSCQKSSRKGRENTGCGSCTSVTCTTSPGCIPTCPASQNVVTQSAFSPDAVAQLKAQLRSRIGS